MCSSRRGLRPYAFAAGNPWTFGDPTGLNELSIEGLMTSVTISYQTVAAALVWVYALACAATVAATGDPSCGRRGRAEFYVEFQADGTDLTRKLREELRGTVPITVAQGLDALTALEGRLSRAQRERRRPAFAAARAWLLGRPPLGVPAPYFKSFYSPGVEGSYARVDVEVIKGVNFEE